MAISYPKQGKIHTLVEERGVSPSASTSSPTFGTLRSSAPTGFSGRPLLLLLKASSYTNTTSTSVEFAVQLDAGAESPIAFFFFNEILEHHNIPGWVVITPTAGSHTVHLRFRRRGGTGSIFLDNNDEVLLMAVEL